MEDQERGTKRRTLLQSAFLLLGGSLALGSAGRAGAKAVADSTPLPPVRSGRGSGIIYGRLRQLHTSSRRSGESGSGRLNSYGILYDRPSGTRIGDFHSTRLCLDSRYGQQPVSPFNVEFQTLNLKEGTLFAMGTPGIAGSGESVHAVVGGTGRYSGARGSYLLRRTAGDADETIEFVLTLLD